MTPWHVCRAPADWSRLTRALDEARRIEAEVYVPMLWVESRRRLIGGQRVRLERQAAAYPGWAFAPTPPDVPGIRALVYADGSPVTITAAAIDRVRECELRWDAEHRDRTAPGADMIPVGEAVRIADGLFAGYVGTVAGRTRDGYQIQLDAAILGAHTITVRPRWVDVVAMARAA